MVESLGEVGEFVSFSTATADSKELGMYAKCRQMASETCGGKFDVAGSEFGLKRVKKSDEEVPADPLQRIQTREPLEHCPRLPMCSAF